MQNKLFLASLLILAACGGNVKKADDQAQIQLDLPKFETGGQAPFALTDEQSELLYKANLLFWNEQVTPEKVQRVSEASVHGRLVRAKFLKFLKEEKAPVKTELDARRVEAQELDVRVVQSRKDNFDEIVELQKPLLVDWLPTRLEQLEAEGKISADDVATAKSQFGIYCQAKLWETAVNPLLARTFRSRPTPLVMCEHYYEDAKLLDRETEACKDAPAGQKKSFLDCFWKEGVLKTELLASRTAACPSSAPGVKRNDAIQQWVASGALQAKLAAEFASANGLVGQGDVVNAVLGNLNLPAGTFTPDCGTAFKGKEGLPVGVTPMLKPLTQLLNIVDIGVATLALYPSNKELLIPSVDGSDEDIVARYTLVANDLMTFAARVGGPSVNDRIFNNDDAKSVREAEDIRAQYDAAPGFAAVRQIEADYVPADLKQLKAANVKRVQELEARVKELNAREFELNTELTDVLAEGALASMDEGVSELFVGFMLKLNKFEDRIEARFQIRSGRGAVGCVSLTAAPCTVARAEQEKDWSDMGSVAFNGDKNELVFDVLLDDPAAQGLIFEAETTKHNLIPSEDLITRILRISAYSNKLEGLLDFFTGKAELIESGKIIREGSVSGDAYGSNAAVWE